MGPGQISCIDWSPTGKEFLMGCLNGIVAQIDRPGKSRHKPTYGPHASLLVCFMKHFRLNSIIADLDFCRSASRYKCYV